MILIMIKFESLRSAESLVSLLSDGELDSLGLGKGDVRLVALADDEDVSNPGSEGVTVGVLDVDDVEGSGMSLTGHDGTHPAGVTPSSDHTQVARVELDRVLDLAGGDVHLDAVVHPDDGVGITDGAAVGGVQVGDGVGAGLDLPDFAQLVLGLLGSDPVHGEPSLHVVDHAEVLAGLLNLDNIHEASGELGISAGLAVNLDEPLLQDGLDLLGVEGVLQAVPDEQSDGQRGGLLVGSGSGLDGEGSSKFIQHPGLGRRQTLKMLLGSTGHFDLLTSLVEVNQAILA